MLAVTVLSSTACDATATGWMYLFTVVADPVRDYNGGY